MQSMISSPTGTRSPRAVARTLLLGALWLAPADTGAQELHGLAGTMSDIPTPQTTYAWKVEYTQGLGEHFGFAAGWLNEGHIDGHHRDGYTLQLGARTPTLSRQLVLGLSGGVYGYFDTVEEDITGYANHHDWGAIATGRASYYFANRLVLHAEVNRLWVHAPSTDSWTALVGLGYQLHAPREPGYRARPVPQRPWTTKNEITAFVGRTVLNSFSSERSVAIALEYRRGIGRYIDWSFAFIDEGDPAVIRRYGLVTQLWAVRSFFSDRMTLGIGGGVYVAIEEKHELGPEGYGEEGTVAELVTPTISWRVTPKFLLRFNWERTLTSYDKDTDIFLFGLGHRF